ncbi:hypothetical protein QE377_002816 [Microbacterium sp. SORGH_AS 862]|nr:hypothetical protein [Microbacterium sp. SORGH_AS_0862]MDQ1206457.1 hypothetical protein [Microbacterium sp. SORGH_AS_0862]
MDDARNIGVGEGIISGGGQGCTQQPRLDGDSEVRICERLSRGLRIRPSPKGEEVIELSVLLESVTELAPLLLLSQPVGQVVGRGRSTHTDILSVGRLGCGKALSSAHDRVSEPGTHACSPDAARK